MDFVHVLNRGVDKRDIVLDDKDRVRFVHDLYVMNDDNTVVHAAQPLRSQGTLAHKRDVLVRIHAFCLMNNHYHLLLSEVKEGGVSKFMRKLNMGYAKYFNERHERTGVLWQGVFRRIPVTTDAHFMYIPYYVHLNPLDFSFPEWRAQNVTDTRKALAFLRAYRWSSHLDYVGIKNFPSIIYNRSLKEMLGAPAVYQREIEKLISQERGCEASLVFE